MRPLSFLHIKERMEPIMFHLFLLLVLTVICVGGLLWVNRIMHLRLAYFFDLQERHRIICDVSLIINKNISRMQVGFENMLLASSEASLINAEEQIRECMETVHRGAVFLETGGVFIENFKVNFDGLDKVAHEFKLQKTMTGFSIASLELRSGLTMLEGMLHEYHAFTSARIAKQAKGQEDASQLGLMHKKLAPFFGRLIEHGNRFYVQSMKELAAIRIRLHQEEQRFMQAMYMVSAGAVLLLLLVGGAVTRSASQVLNERAEARKNLVAANEWLEERVATRTAALLASEGRLQDIALTSGDIIWQTDAQGQFIYVAGQTAKLLGISAEEIIGQSMSRFIADTAEGMEALHLLEQKMRNKEAMIDFVCPLLSAVDGCIRYFLINAIPMRQKDGGGFFGTSKDISEKMAYESRLRLLAKVFESAQEGITITDAQGTIEVVNPAFTTITGYTAAEAIGKNPRILKSEHHPPEFYQVMWDTLKHQGIWTGEIWNRRKSGEAYPEWLSITMVRDEAGAPRHYVAVFHDITAMKEKEAEITRMAYFDSLTSLPNRTMLLERFGVALMKAETTQRRYAVVYVDLDNFKLVNDSLGHEAGDYLLVEVARRFQSLVNGNDLIARLGGDEFVFLLEVQGEEPFDPLHYSNQIQQSLAAPIRVHELDIFITPSIGIALYPDDGRSAQTLLKHADLAMYSAKDTGKNQYVVFQEEMKAKVAVRLSLENHLRQALSRKEIFPVFQPKLCLHTQKIIGVESLARWISEAQGMVAPSTFIPVAEETGLIVPIGQSILEQSCVAMRTIQEQTGLVIKVAVNVSGRQFRHHGFIDDVCATILQTDIALSQVELEITESMLLGDVQIISAKLRHLAALGLTISIDDFGTGYSSLSYLSQLPIHRLKIDRSFIQRMANDPNTLDLLRAIIQMGKSLRVNVLAEGVERPEDMQLLMSLGCDEVQGYVYARPMSLEQLLIFLDSPSG